MLDTCVILLKFSIRKEIIIESGKYQYKYERYNIFMIPEYLVLSQEYALK